MSFMHDHWRAGHILSTNEELFLYDFRDADRLTMAIALTEQDEIVGLFGYIPYNGSALPDLAGSLWKALDVAGEPMLGLQMRRFVMENVPHRYFAAPGAGLQTRAIYHLIDMHWVEMAQYYIINPAITEQRLAKATPSGAALPAIRDHSVYRFEEIGDPRSLRDFPFTAYTELGPQKDWTYLYKRFFEHPIYRYRTFLLSKQSEAVNIVVCREAQHAGASALRVVDFYGDERHMPGLTAHLAATMQQAGHEYLDFVCSGFTPRLMAAAGWQALDFDSKDVIIPNYFEPFVQSNVRVYAVADRHPEIQPRLCKADGDQDRPNFDRAETAPVKAAGA